MEERRLVKKKYVCKIKYKETFCDINFFWPLDQSCCLFPFQIDRYSFILKMFISKELIHIQNMLYCYRVKETFTLIIERLFNNNLNFIIFFIKSLNSFFKHVVGRVHNYGLKKVLSN